jgi:uncharacterized membrane protein YgcG
MINRNRRRPPSRRGGAYWSHMLTGLALFSGLLVSGCGSTAQIPSSWRTRGVTVDSAAREWKSAFTPIKDTHLFIGMQNDSAFFYLRILAPEDEFRRRIAGPGMTVWLEPQDGKKLGILYPMGTGIHDMEILGAEKNDRTLFSPLEVPGVSVRVGSSEGSSMYELKVPLQASKDRPYAVGATPGSTFRIEIQTEKEVVGMREGGGRSSGGEGGGYGGGGGGGGGFGGGGRRGGGGGGGEAEEGQAVRAAVHSSTLSISRQTSISPGLPPTPQKSSTQAAHPGSPSNMQSIVTLIRGARSGKKRRSEA